MKWLLYRTRAPHQIIVFSDEVGRSCLVVQVDVLLLCPQLHNGSRMHEGKYVGKHQSFGINTGVVAL